MFTRKKNWFTVKEAADQLRIGETTLRVCIKDGHTECVMVDDVTRISPRYLKRFAQSTRYQDIKDSQRKMLQGLLNRVESGEVMEAIKAW